MNFNITIQGRRFSIYLGDSDDFLDHILIAIIEEFYNDKVDSGKVTFARLLFILT